MRWKLWILLFAMSALASAAPACSQVTPSYQGHLKQVSLGIGLSGYNPGWGQGAMFGGAAWADWQPQFLPRGLRGLGIEMEVRDLSLDRHLPSEANVRQDTFSGGPMYLWSHFTSFHPYGKFLIGHGSFDFTSISPFYSHDTRTFLAPGGGFECRIHPGLWARADYEYQSVQTLIGDVHHPQGFTAGLAYNFGDYHPAKR